MVVALGLLVVLLAASTGATEATVGTDFCGRRLAVRQCPSPKSIDGIDLTSFLGSYFQVGATASYKLRAELGMACSRTNFSVENTKSEAYNNLGTAYAAADPETNGSVTFINVQNSAVPVVAPNSQTMTALYRISASASGVCAAAAHICALTFPESPINEALLRISAVYDQVSVSVSPTVSFHARPLFMASLTINNTITTVHGQLDRLSTAVNTLVRISAAISQAPVVPRSPTQTLLRTIRDHAGIGSREVAEMGSFAIGNLTFAGGIVSRVEARVRLMDSDSAELLREAVVLIRREVDMISNQVARLQGLLSGIHGPLTDMIEAETMNFEGTVPSIRATESLGMTSMSASALIPTRVVVSTGHAMQSTDQPSDRFLPTFKPLNTTQPYKVIAAEPAANHDIDAVGSAPYSRLLLYTCTPKHDSTSSNVGDLYDTSTVTQPKSSASGHGLKSGTSHRRSNQNKNINNNNNVGVVDAGRTYSSSFSTELILLSSSPILPPPSTVFNLLDIASSYGIFTDCDSAFVPSLQRPDDCFSA